MTIEPATFKELLEELGKAPTSGEPGRIIVLNGTSSSGKTTIAKLLQHSLYEEGLGSYIYFPVDDFDKGLPQQVRNQPELLVKELPAVIHAHASAVAAAALSGINILADVVFTELNWAQAFATKTKDLDVIYVGVMCSLERTKQREAARGDRPVGLAEYQYDRVHRNIDYSLTVDTTETKPEENVTAILNYLKSRPH